MILVDSSVWIDYFRGTPTAAAAKLDALLGTVPLAIGDLIATEVLQGCRTGRELALIRKAFDAFELVTLGGEDVAFQAAANFRLLRARGATVRKTIDTIIATRCIVSGFELLHSDRDFDPFEVHLGLRCVRCDA